MFRFLRNLLRGSAPATPPVVAGAVTPALSVVDDYYYRIRQVAGGAYADLPDGAKHERDSVVVKVDCLAAGGRMAETWLDLRDIPAGLGKLKDPNQVVVAKGQISLMIDHPLSRIAVADVVTDRPEGFTLAALLHAVRDVYEDIYAQETATQSTPTPPLSERRTPSRPPSDGTFGISGYDMEELGIGGLIITYSEDGIWVRPEVTS